MSFPVLVFLEVWEWPLKKVWEWWETCFHPRIPEPLQWETGFTPTRALCLASVFWRCAINGWTLIRNSDSLQVCTLSHVKRRWRTLEEESCQILKMKVRPCTLSSSVNRYVFLVWSTNDSVRHLCLLCCCSKMWYLCEQDGNSPVERKRKCKYCSSHTGSWGTRRKWHQGSNTSDDN